MTAAEAPGWRDELVAHLQAEYSQRFPRSREVQGRALRYLVDGGSHALRLFDPFPFRVVSAQGARARDLDGHDIVDYWQGHYANILGHNPPVIAEPLAELLRGGYGLHTGLAEEAQTDLAEALLRQTGDERVRFTTAGSLATMYAVMLARAFTGRTLVLKIAGGWHGSQPLALRGTRYGAQGFTSFDSQGLPEEAAGQTLVTSFNDLDALTETFRQYGDRLACFILEPCPGQAFIPAHPEYLRAARELTERHGALLILDEIITGFRFCAGGLQKLYGVRGDLSTYGKIVGGGMPLSAIAGRADVLDLAGKPAGRQVLVEGGTFSAHPASMRAGKLLLGYLSQHESAIYPKLAAVAERLREGIERTFAGHGILARCSGRGNEAVPGSSLVQVHFPRSEDTQLANPEHVWDPRYSDAQLRERVLRLGLLLRDVNVTHGLGAVSAAHSDADLAQTLAAFAWVAERIAGARAV